MSDGLARRIQIPYGSDAGRRSFDLYDFGVEVDIEAPPAEEILSEEEFEKMMEKECSRREATRTHDEARCVCVFESTEARADGDRDRPD